MAERDWLTMLANVDDMLTMEERDWFRDHHVPHHFPGRAAARWRSSWGTLGHMRWGRKGKKGGEGKRRREEEGEKKREKERKLEAFGTLSVIFMCYSPSKPPWILSRLCRDLNPRDRRGCNKSPLEAWVRIPLLTANFFFISI